MGSKCWHIRVYDTKCLRERGRETDRDTEDAGVTHHDDITRSDADLVVAARVKRIQSPVVNNLHRWLLLETAERHLLVKQVGTWSLVNWKPKKIFWQTLGWACLMTTLGGVLSPSNLNTYLQWPRGQLAGWTTLLVSPACLFCFDSRPPSPPRFPSPSCPLPPPPCLSVFSLPPPGSPCWARHEAQTQWVGWGLCRRRLLLSRPSRPASLLATCSDKDEAHILTSSAKIQQLQPSSAKIH